MIPLEKHVVSLDLAKRLTELGVKQGSLFWWIEILGGYEIWHHSNTRNRKGGPAFTVAELGEMLPNQDGSVNICAIFKATEAKVIPDPNQITAYYVRYRPNRSCLDSSP
jgi:hypothetical protein